MSISDSHHVSEPGIKALSGHYRKSYDCRYIILHSALGDNWCAEPAILHILTSLDCQSPDVRTTLSPPNC